MEYSITINLMPWRELRVKKHARLLMCWISTTLLITDVFIFVAHHLLMKKIHQTSIHIQTLQHKLHGIPSVNFSAQQHLLSTLIQRTKAIKIMHAQNRHMINVLHYLTESLPKTVRLTTIDLMPRHLALNAIANTETDLYAYQATLKKQFSNIHLVSLRNDASNVAIHAALTAAL